MVKNEYSKWLLICGFILAASILILPVVYTKFYHNITGVQAPVKGNMDLSEVNLANGKIYLEGQWEFYWNSFIVSEPKKVGKPNLIMKVPDEWSHYNINDERLPAEGFGSYKLELTGFQYDNAVTLLIPDFGGSI